MTTEARISPDYLGQGLKIAVLRTNSFGTAALVEARSNERPDLWRRVDEAVELPFIWIDEETGRALLEALLEHYNGGQNTRQLRNDYDAERARVDKFINKLVGE